MLAAGVVGSVGLQEGRQFHECICHTSCLKAIGPGQFDNSQGFIGVRNPTYGTLSVGRVNSLTLDGAIAYDPMGSAYAFSPFGYSGSFAGFGDTETNRVSTGVRYRVDFMNFHGAGLVQ